MTGWLAIVLVSRKRADEFLARVRMAVGYPLPSINDGRRPLAMDHNLLVRFSSSRPLGSEPVQAPATESDDADSSLLEREGRYQHRVVMLRGERTDPVLPGQDVDGVTKCDRQFPIGLPPKMPFGRSP